MVKVREDEEQQEQEAQAWHDDVRMSMELAHSYRWAQLESSARR